MTRVLLLGDGPRDAAMIPAILDGILEIRTRCEFKAWRDVRLNSRHDLQRGYERKLQFSMRSAVADGIHGVVAVVDRDREERGVRIGKLRAARERERAVGNAVPTACGQADPNGEAWLLDDVEAVKIALQLHAGHTVPSATYGDPKQHLEALLQSSPRRLDSPIEVWGDIARVLRESKCRAPKATGFEAFVRDVKAEFANV